MKTPLIKLNTETYYWDSEAERIITDSTPVNKAELVFDLSDASEAFDYLHFHLKNQADYKVLFNH